MIVEDEPWIAKGLENILPWEELDIEIVGIAGNGLEALQALDSCQPDIILTDIMMPVMNGMEFIHKLPEVIEQMPKVIIITGYNEFTYAQQAIRHGIADYLLKPIDPADLERIICTLLEELENERVGLRKFHKILIENTLYENLLMEENRNPDIQLPFSKFIVLFTVNPIPAETLSSQEYVRDWYALSYLNNHIYVLGFQTESFADLFLKHEFSQLETKSMIGMSWKYDSASFHFYDAYKEAEYNFQKRYQEFSLHQDDIQPILLHKEQEKQWIQLLQEGNVKTVYDKMKQLLQGYTTFEQKWGLVFQYYLFLSKFAANTSGNTLYMLKKARNDKELNSVLETIISPLLEMISADWQGTVSDLTRKAVAIIEQDYTNSFLSLQDVAKRLGITAAYLSVIFKNEIGINYIHFVTLKRLEAAKKALLETQKTIHDISSICGFNDVKYFIKVFKKEVGVTPNKYREIYSFIK